MRLNGREVSPEYIQALEDVRKATRTLRESSTETPEVQHEAQAAYDEAFNRVVLFAERDGY